MSSGSSCKWKDLPVEGVIFQLTPEFVLFEFRLEGEESIGIVPTSCIVLRNDERIPRSALEKGSTSLGKYLEVGDELKCRVNRNTDPNKCVYVEEEKERVMIRPEWNAEKAFLLSRLRYSSKNSGGGGSSGSAEVVREEEEDLRALLQVRKIEKYKGSSSSSSSRRGRDSREASPRRRSKYEGSRPSSSSSSKSSRKPEESSKSRFYRAELLALKKPPRHKDIVVSGIMEITDDSKYSGRKAVFSNTSLSLYGHPLGRVDLSYYLRMGDEFTVELIEIEGSLSVKRAWAFEEKGPPRRPEKCPNFHNWLRSRDIPFESFTDWVLGKTPPRPFFPFPSPSFSGVLECVLREECPQGDGGLLRITSEGKHKDKTVVFERSDLYIEGVSVGHSDLRILLRPGDPLNVQVLEMTPSDVKRYKYMMPKGVRDAPLCAQLVFVGRTVPKGPYGSLEGSEGLKAYLDAVGLSLSEFGSMRDSPPNSTPIVTAALSGPLTFIKTLTDNLPIHEHNRIMFALSLTVRALGISSVSDSKANDLLQTPEDISNAVWLSKIFTQVLIRKMQTKMRDKITQKFGSLIGSSFKEQEKQLTSYELIQTQEEAARNLAALKDQGLLEEGGKKPIVEIMKKVEKQMESSKNQPGMPSGSKGPKRDMKKILESYASSTSSGSRTKPLEILHQFIHRNKTIALRNGVLYFGELGYPIATPTNFPIGGKYGKKYYSIYDLYFFWRNSKAEHPIYKRMAGKEKVNCVLPEDRQVVNEYFMGQNAVLNPPVEDESLPPPAPSIEDPPPAKKMKISSISPPPIRGGEAAAKPPTSRWISLPSFSLTSANNTIPHPVNASGASSSPELKPKVGGFSSSSPELKPKVGGFSSSSLDLKPKVGGFSSSSPDLKPKVGGFSSSSPDLKPKVGGFSSSFSGGNKKTPGTGFSSAFGSKGAAPSLRSRNSSFFGHGK